MTNEKIDYLRTLGMSLPNNINGSEVSIPCPFCKHERSTKKLANHPCMRVNLNKIFPDRKEGIAWHCHHCKKSGGKSFIDEDGVVMSMEPQNIMLNHDHKEWFISRGISMITVKKLGIESDGERIKYPFNVLDKEVNAKYRSVSPDYRCFTMQSGGDRVPYNYIAIEKASKHKEMLIWAEGEMDVCSLIEVGFNNVTSPPNGANPNLSYLDSIKDMLDQIPEHIIAVDDDKQGHILKNSLIEYLGADNCSVVAWEPSNNIKDASDYLNEYGKKNLKHHVLNNSREVKSHGVKTSLDVADRIFDILENGRPEGFSTGIKKLDEKYKVYPEQWTLWTGMPGAGKTTVLTQILFNLARNDGWKFCCLFAENPIYDQVIEFIQRHFNKDITELKDKKKEVETLIQWLNEHFFFLDPDSDEISGWNIDSILAVAERYIDRYKVNGVLIDPWNDIHRPSHIDEKEHIRTSIMKIKKLARRKQVHVWVVAHPTKMARNERTGMYEVPSAYQISGSHTWRDKGDFILCSYLPELRGREGEILNSNHPEIHIQKVRFRWAGKMGLVVLKYDEESGTIT